MKRALLLALLLAPGAASAGEWGATYVERPLDFTARLGRQKLDLEGVAGATTIDRIGVGWRERYGARLELGLSVDYVALTQENTAITAGRELTGYDAGLSLDADLLRVGPAALFLRATLSYLRVDDEDPDQSLVISWTEPAVRLGVRGPLGAGVRAYAGVRYGLIDGEERLRGAANATRALEEDQRVGGFAGLELALERNGYVGVAAESGPDRMFGIYFGRQF